MFRACGTVTRAGLRYVIEMMRFVEKASAYIRGGETSTGRESTAACMRKKNTHMMCGVLTIDE